MKGPYQAENQVIETSRNLSSLGDKKQCHGGQLSLMINAQCMIYM